MISAPDMVDAYLRRLGLDGMPGLHLEGLQLLHRRHVTRVPREELGGCATTAHTLPGLVDQITRRGRGSTATGLNLAFAMLLVGVGFDVTPLQATTSDSGVPGDALRLVLSVDIGGRAYLADVSGAIADEPLDLGAPGWQGDASNRYRVRQDQCGQGVDLVGAGGARYRLSSLRSAADFGPAVALARPARPHPDRLGAGVPVISLRRQRGVTTLVGRRLVETNGDGRTVIDLRPEEARRVVRARFGVQLTPVEERCLCGRGR